MSGVQKFVGNKATREGGQPTRNQSVSRTALVNQMNIRVQPRSHFHNTKLSSYPESAANHLQSPTPLFSQPYSTRDQETAVKFPSSQQDTKVPRDIPAHESQSISPEPSIWPGSLLTESSEDAARTPQNRAGLLEDHDDDNSDNDDIGDEDESSERGFPPQQRDRLGGIDGQMGFDQEEQDQQQAAENIHGQNAHYTTPRSPIRTARFNNAASTNNYEDLQRVADRGDRGSRSEMQYGEMDYEGQRQDGHGTHDQEYQLRGVRTLEGSVLGDETLSVISTSSPTRQIHSNVVSSNKRIKRKVDELDYDEKRLYNMKYQEIKDEPFDQVPKNGRICTSQLAPEAALDTRLAHFEKQEFDMQLQFISELSYKEWEEAGDWFLGRFMDLMKQLRDARKERRGISEIFEEHLARRDKIVSEKSLNLDSTLQAMREGGMTVLRGKSPRT
jgi:hypothetical protein